MLIVPRSFNNVLTDALNSLVRTWRALLSTALIAFVPAGIGSLLAFQISGADEFLELIFNDPGYLEALPTEVIVELATPFLQATAIAVAIQGVASLFVYLVSHRVAGGDAAGYHITGREARRDALRRFFRAILTGIVVLVTVGGIIFIASFALIIPSVFLSILIFLALLGPALWLAGALSMWTAVVALEDRGIFASLARSLDLVRGRWWPTIGFLLLVGLLGTVAIQLIQLVAIPLSFVGSGGIGITVISLLSVAAQGVIVAGLAAVYTGWYVDLRARKEELLREQLI